MQKKWIVIPSVLVLAVLGAFVTQPMWRPLWERVNPPPKMAVDRALRTQTIDTLVAKLNNHYIFPDKAKQIEAVLRQRQQEGKYDRLTDGEQLAKQLTEDMRGVASDLHMAVEFSPGVVPPDPVGPPPATLAEWEKDAPLPLRLLRHVYNFDVEKVDHLDSGIGYLKLSGFSPVFLAAGTHAEAMDELADTRGLIVDLRDTRGGDPRSVASMISYFVDRRTRLNDMWDRDTNVTTQQWTVDKLAGKRYGGKKPVVILVGPGTLSGCEDFAYTMQALKRATVIGERTWGGAHPARPFRLGDHFYAVIPHARPINPVTRSNWEGVGVIPDIPAAPDKALAVARDLLQRQLQGAAPLASAAH